MNYTSNNDVKRPTAHITKKKSRLKVYNGHIVFMEDKDNFEFEIHNPKQNSVLVKIKLNGEYISGIAKSSLLPIKFIVKNNLLII